MVRLHNFDGPPDRLVVPGAVARASVSSVSRHTVVPAILAGPGVPFSIRDVQAKGVADSAIRLLFVLPIVAKHRIPHNYEHVRVLRKRKVCGDMPGFEFVSPIGIEGEGILLLIGREGPEVLTSA